MSGHKNILLGMLIIGGAYLYTRSAAAATSGTGTVAKTVMQPVGASPSAALGTGSMPGSVGNGVSQIAGGLIGNLLSAKSGGGTSTGAPVASSTQDYSADYMLQNSVPAADPQNTYDPVLSNPIGGALFDSMGQGEYA